MQNIIQKCDVFFAECKSIIDAAASATDTSDPMTEASVHAARQKRCDYNTMRDELVSMHALLSKSMSVAKALLIECEIVDDERCPDAYEETIPRSVAVRHMDFVDKDSDGFMVVKKVSYKDVCTHEDVVEKEQKSIYINSIDSIDVAPILFNSVSGLCDIAPIMSYYEGDSKRPPGIYTSIKNNVYVRVHLPDSIDNTREMYRKKVIRCNHKTIENCEAARKKYMLKSGKEIKECMFVHIGEKYNKIVSNNRCQDIPRFGRIDTLKTDMDYVSFKDIKLIMHYALSDMLLVYMWFESQVKNQVVIDDADVYSS